MIRGQGKGKGRKPQHPKNKSSPSKKQNALSDLVKNALTKVESLFGVFLVRQALRARTEQFITVALTRDDAIWFCRNYLTPKYCNENNKSSLKFFNPVKDETLRVNSDNDHLLIKGIDFNRREAGRTNQDPLWYLNIAEITIVNKESIIKMEQQNGNT